VRRFIEQPGSAEAPHLTSNNMVAKTAFHSIKSRYPGESQDPFAHD
jgi:hypothetical protein